MDMPLASGLWSEVSSGCIKHDGLLWVTSPLGRLTAKEQPGLLLVEVYMFFGKLPPTVTVTVF